MANTKPMEGERRSVNSELWHACAGPSISLPPIGSLVVYFPQGHSEQLAASTFKEINGPIPSYPNLQSQLVCQLHNVALHADPETDEVFAQMTLQPVNDQEKELYMAPDVGLQSRQPTDFFCKILTASDTSTHGGFSVPRRAAEKVFPPLDFSKQPPAQELRAKDLHGMEWTFRHIFRGQPKRHLLTTGWSVFVSAKRLVAGDSVLFIRDDKGQLLLGIRRASSKQQSVLPSSVLSSDSMHIGVLAAAAHAAATNSRFQVFYNPRTSPSEFVIPFSKYRKAVHFIQVSVGMRFRMVFETEESTLRRYMGTITGISDLDPTRWPGSKWRNLEVGWDESSAGERPRRVSLWETEPVSTPFLICPSPFALRPKRPLQSGYFGEDDDVNGNMKRCLTWLRGDNGFRDPMCSTYQSVGGDISWMQFQERADPVKSYVYDTMAAAALQELKTVDPPKVLHSSLPPQGQLSLPQQLQQPLLLREPLQSNVMWAQPITYQPVIFQNQQQLPLILPPSLPQARLVEQSQAVQLPHASLTSVSPSSLAPSTLPHLQSPSSQQNLYSIQQREQQNQQQQQFQQQQNQQQQQHHHHQFQLQQQQQKQKLQQQHQYQHQQQQQQLEQQYQQRQFQDQLLPPVVVQPLFQGLQQQPFSQVQPALANQSYQQTQLAPQVQQSIPQTQQHVLQVRHSTNQTQQASHMQQSLPQAQQPESKPSDISAQEYHNNQPQVLPSLPMITSSMLAVESDSGFGSMLAGVSSPCQQNVLNNMYRGSANATMLEETQSRVHMPDVKAEPQELNAPESLTVMPNYQKIETTLNGSWYPFSNETTYCDSQLLPVNQIGHSDTSSSTVTSCSYSLPIESADNSLYMPSATASFQTRLSNINTDTHCMPSNENAFAGSLTSPSGSFTSATPDCGPISGAVVANGLLDETILQQSWPQVAAPLRTYTKVHKSGSVGRSIDLSRLTSYEELRLELARMFNIEGQIEDPHRSYWQLVFVDSDGDILLVGDDPWDEFVSCVRAIKILSTPQVLQMNQGGLEQLSILPLQQTSSSSEDCQVWRDI